jgi:uncharacterized membrane protein YfcA
MTDALDTTAAIALVFILAGLVKGVIGMGLPTVAMGFLTLLMPPAEAAAVLILPSFVTNVWQLAAGTGLMALLRRLWLMQVAAALATVAAALWLGPVNSAAAVTGLGAALVLYALVSLAPLDLGLPAAAEPWLGPIVGAATGIVTALTGVFVLPAVPYLQALRLDPEELVQALGLSFTVSTLALGVALAADGQFHAPHLGASLLGLLAAIAGMWLGQTLRTRMRPASFRLWFLLGLMGLGAHLMLRAAVTFTSRPVPFLWP